MGTNRRYPERADERSDDLLLAQAKRGAPVSLTTSEVRRTGRRNDAREAVPVTATIRYRVAYEEPREVEGTAIAWTRGAVLVQYPDPATRHDNYVWVYANAVRRRG
ncbi:hypothetical protein PX701_09545 [Agromyces sp. H3Y2-19a]|jgi:hypothetical protein|uniref:hypothetical protein n=1 Tax=Agromyces TaxID=33877 RepID=UPI001E2FF488|nr:MULTISPECIES: hypothetical protein [Agromyces]MCD5344959.1 hypothetical protein [Agromyces sp. S2-1-8]MDF0513863.1 hypothetical protein [Agromyces chromiiresistens]